MSNQMKDKQVLAAILNVKKYAKNLKKKASIRKQENEDGDSHEIVSTPSFFEHRPNQLSQISSPTIVVKSTCREPIQNMNRQKKEHSMTFLPDTKKPNRKNSQFLILEPSSPGKKPGSKINLSQSYKMQIASQAFLESGWRKQSNNSSSNFSKLERKNKFETRERSEMSEVDIKLSKTISLIGEKERKNGMMSKSLQSNKTYQINPKVVEQLLNQIEYLKNQICNYKKALIALRTKYLQMQQKCNEKVQTDHLLDTLKMQIQILQSRNDTLNNTIAKQNEKIASFESLIVEISNKLMNHYADQTYRLSKLQTENQIYRQLLFLKNPTLQRNIQQQGKNQSLISKNKAKNQQVSSQSESENDTKPIHPGEFCKSENDFKNKYMERGKTTQAINK